MTLVSRRLAGLRLSARRPSSAPFSTTTSVIAACSALACLGSLAITIVTDQRDPLPSTLAQIVIPTLIASLVIASRGKAAGALSAAFVLLLLEALLAGWLFDVGVAFALLFPLMGIGLVHPVLGRRGRQAAYGSAGVAALAGEALALTVSGNAPVLGRNAPLLTLIEFAAIFGISLALLWRAGELRRLAGEAERAALEAQLDAQRRAARAQESLFRLVESSPIPTFALDASGRVQLWNAAAEHVLGWKAVDLIGRPLPSGIVPDDALRDRSVPDADATAAGGRPVQRLEVRRPDGSRILVELYLAPASALAEDAPGTICQLVDVTQLEQEEVRRRHAARMEAVGRLAAGIAHDVESMLAAMTAVALRALDAVGEGPGAAEISSMLDGAADAGALVRQMLLFARSRPPEPELVGMGSAIRAIAPTLRALLGPSVSVAIRDRTRDAAVRIDHALLDQAILNLAVNARDAMPDGGRLEVRLERVESGGERQRIRLVVADTGSGIDPAIKGRIFEPFFTTKGSGAGHGLGLANVLDIVQGAGGDIRVESEPGCGSRFEIDLPIAA